MNPVAERPPLEVLVFEVGGRRYGLPAADVRELIRAVAVVPLPGAPPLVEGVINVRGRVVPVLDVRARLGLPAKPPEPADHLIVARAGERPVALRVDRATDLVRLDPAGVEEARGLVPGLGRAGWVARLADGVLLVHDLVAFLSQGEAARLDDALPDGRPPGQERGQP
jgi:purine-binding chemotaxis protein CheW